MDVVISKSDSSTEWPSISIPDSILSISVPGTSLSSISVVDYVFTLVGHYLTSEEFVDHGKILILAQCLTCEMQQPLRTARARLLPC